MADHNRHCVLIIIIITRLIIIITVTIIPLSIIIIIITIIRLPITQRRPCNPTPAQKSRLSLVKSAFATKKTEKICPRFKKLEKVNDLLNMFQIDDDL